MSKFVSVTHVGKTLDGGLMEVKTLINSDKIIFMRPMQGLPADDKRKTDIVTSKPKNGQTAGFHVSETIEEIMNMIG